jgi:hypothetical protein
MTQGECGAMLAIAGKMYGKPINTSLVEAWHEFMGDVTPAEGVAAMKKHIVESPHFPTVADIRKRVAEDRVGSADPGAAWEEVRRAIQRCGRDHEPVWSSAAIAGAVDAIGWRELCNTMMDDLSTVRAQFERYFRARVESRAKDANYGALEAHADKRIGPKSAGDLIQLPAAVKK